MTVSAILLSFPIGNRSSGHTLAVAPSRPLAIARVRVITFRKWGSPASSRRVAGWFRGRSGGDRPSEDNGERPTSIPRDIGTTASRCSTSDPRRLPFRLIASETAVRAAGLARRLGVAARRGHFNSSIAFHLACGYEGLNIGGGP